MRAGSGDGGGVDGKQRRSVAEIEARLAELDTETRGQDNERKGLLRERRATVAGQASARARQQKVRERNQKIRAEYDAAGKNYGLIKRLARNYGLSAKQIHRVLADGGQQQSAKQGPVNHKAEPRIPREQAASLSSAMSDDRAPAATAIAGRQIAPRIRPPKNPRKRSRHRESPSVQPDFFD